MIDNPQRDKAFTASRISELLAQGTGATRKNYILDVAKASIGVKDDFDNAAMRHGTVTQQTAFEVLKKYFWNDYPSAKWFDKYIAINDNCGASPDILLDDVTPFDIKCPYYIDTWLEQVKKVPNKYFYQIQMQLMATGGDMCGIGFFLSKPEVFGQENWEEYPMSVTDRTKPFMFPRSEEICDSILSAVEKAVPERDLYIEKLKSCTIMDEVEYFQRQLKSDKFRSIDKCANIEKATIIRIENTDRFYYEVKK